MANEGSELFLIPLLAAGGSLSSRLAGILAVRTDGRGNIIGEPLKLYCTLPSHLLPSPALFLRQSIDPLLLKRGLSEYDFYDRLELILTDPKVTLIVWNSSHLKVLDAMALRLFKDPAILAKPKALCNLKALINLCNLFSEKKLPHGLTLSDYVKALGLVNPAKDADALKTIPLKLLSLIRLKDFLSDLEPKMSSFTARPTALKYQDLDAALKDHKVMVQILENGSAALMIPINKIVIGQEGSYRIYYEAAAYLDESFVKITVDPLSCEIAAPLGILTSQRLLSLGLDEKKKQEIILRLEHYAKEGLEKLEDKTAAPVAAEFFDRLNPVDTKYYLELKNLNPRAFTRAPLQCSAFFRQLLFLFRAENFPGTLIEQEYSLYEKITVQKLQKALPRFLAELKLEAEKLDEKDPMGSAIALTLYQLASPLEFTKT